MKLKLTLLTTLAGLGFATAQAQQPDNPQAAAPNGEKPSHERRDRSRPPSPQDARRGGDQEAVRSEQKPVAYMGVITREVPAELRSQFSLPAGFGLMVDEIMEDSPAAQAGIKVHDILVKFGDQDLVNMEQLMTLVRGKKKGDVVNLAIITGGKETQMSVKLGERMMPAEDRRVETNRPGFGWPHMQTFRFDSPMLGGPAGGGGVHIQPGPGGVMFDQEGINKAVREYQERVQQWMRDGQRGPMPEFPQLPGLPGMPGGHNKGRDGGKFEHREERHESHDGKSSSSSSSSASGWGNGGGNTRVHIDTNVATHIIRRDESGEYSLKREDGKTTFTVRPNNGQEQSWPVNNDQERAAVPQEFREKLKMFDNMPGQPRMAPPGGGNAPAQPAPDKPKGRPTSA